ncbi:MAG: M20/M25/M40 family metallo-hydrolase [Phycisphaerales bacterium]|nr:M20/M25/M40 family metallo-hydrolase [Phycisphaerales bacterium]
MQTPEQLRRFLCDLVAIRSISREEGPIVDHLSRVLSGQAGHAPPSGLHVQRELNNLWIEIGDQPRPRLLFNSHLDTVPPAEGWSADPWTPRVEGGRITGLGANDAKGCVTALLAAALRIADGLARGQRLGGTLVVALTAEEEISGRGLSEVLPRLRPLDAAIVGEPTSLTPMIAQRGLLILRCTAIGRSRHPANTPADSPDNAIHTAAADILRLRDFDFGAPHPLLGTCHAHVTMVSGGVARNVVPDRCEFWADIRTTPNQPHDALVERIRAELSSEVHVHSGRLGPVQTARSEPIVQACEAALPDASPAGSPAMSDMVFLPGIPAVKIGPGDTRRSHTPDEWVLESELAAGAGAYERIAREYFARMASAGA